MDDDLIPTGDPDGDADDGDVVIAHGRAGNDPNLIRDPPPQPLLSVRRLVILVVLAVAVGCLVVAAQSGGGTEGEGNDLAVVAYDPRPGGQVARQAPVGVELEPGYDGRLTINGVPIPEEQMLGAITPGTEAFANLPPEQQDLGPRPNNKNVVKFQPGPGKAVSQYDTGNVDISVRFWKVAEGRDESRTITYTIRVF
ncbi:MAG: hypothetical protein ACR2JF_01955 [Iamia sp.]